VFDQTHLRFVVMPAGSRSDPVEAVELVGAEFDVVGSGVLLDP
jgi:hypothetical protein